MLISVVTPTYNRANLLPNAFRSLAKQTCLSFEWIIIDDGSEDDTEEVVCRFQPASFSITYVRKENGGKHTALNESHRYINGDVVVILDSDDSLHPDAIETIALDWEAYSTDSVRALSYPKKNVSVRRQPCLPSESFVSDHFSFRINADFPYDCCEVTDADLFCRYEFPVFPKERFMGESWLWNTLCLAGVKTAYINKMIYDYEYLDSGLTRSGRALRMSSPRGGMANSKSYFSDRVKLSRRLKEACLFVCYGKAAGFKAMEMLRRSGHPLLVVATFVPGVLLNLIWSKQI